jgi:hypothetical protein
MIPVHCRVKHDPENGTYGDCLRACVATIMEMDAEQVPHFFHDNCDGETAMHRLREWSRQYGVGPFTAHFSGDIPMADVLAMQAQQNGGVPYMLFGSTESGNHVVVCRNDKVVHDPAWYSSPLVKAGAHGHWSVMVLARI